MKITIAVNHLYLKKGHTDILDNVSFTVPSGVVCAFIGHNGAGKTTTIKSILNLRPYNSGTVKINGIDSKNIKSRESVGYIPEKAIAVNMNTKVFIKEMAQYHKWTHEKVNKFITMICEKFDFPQNRLSTPLKRLSSGQSKIITIAQAFIGHPLIIIADEPTDNLDPDARDLFWNFVKYIRQHNRQITFFISTHQLDEIENYANYIVAIRNGQIKFSGKFVATKQGSLREKYHSFKTQD